MGCGASSETRVEEYQLEDAHTHVTVSNVSEHLDGSQEEVFPSLRDSVGKETTEHPSFLKIKLATRVMQARLLHGIDGDPEQFEDWRQGSDLSKKQHAAVCQFVDDHVQTIVQNDLDEQEECTIDDDTSRSAVSKSTSPATTPKSSHYRMSPSMLQVPGAVESPANAPTLLLPHFADSELLPIATENRSRSASHLSLHSQSQLTSAASTTSKVSSHFDLPAASLRNYIDYELLADAVHYEEMRSLSLGRFLKAKKKSRQQLRQRLSSVSDGSLLLTLNGATDSVPSDARSGNNPTYQTTCGVRAIEVLDADAAVNEMPRDQLPGEEVSLEEPSHLQLNAVVLAEVKHMNYVADRQFFSSWTTEQKSLTVAWITAGKSNRQQRVEAHNEAVARHLKLGSECVAH